ncbi:MAG: peptide chain release factor N(5)-glutamine methyltransferase [Planctomycetota bacterium]|nr:peptide chain release factor N(5)-glutamine methyltransferase [Planctomycetota bacterium]
MSTRSSGAAPRIWTTLELLKWTADYFKKKGLESPRLQAELLLAEVLGCDRVRLYVDFEKPVPAPQLERYREFVRRRGEAREPLQYIVGHAPFLALKLKVTPAVLIPRPETEELAAWAVEKLKAVPGEAPRLLDLGAGSGCLALAAAHGEPRASVLATDASAAALEVARENAAALGLAGRVAFAEGDLFAAVPGDWRGQVDVLVSNPPYIDEGLRETLAPEVREHEPAAALFAANRGLAVLERIVAEAAAYVKGGGSMGLECSPEQAGALVRLLEARGEFEAPRSVPDLSGKPRFVHAVRRAV